MEASEKTAETLRNKPSRAGFLTRLGRDQRGNALVIVAASTIPVLGAIGGGVDMARAYTAEARLSQACDASVLAGRKLLRDADVDGAGKVKAGSPTDQEIDRFQDYNFAAGQFGTAPVARTATVDNTGQLTIRLATTMPTQLLRVVGINSINIDTDCSSRRSGVNVDVVMVLDVTGSMDGTISGTTRIAALRGAAGNFLDILDELGDQLDNQGLRVRVGVVPYATAVNVGHDLIAENASYVETTNLQYYSRMRELCLASAANSYCGRTAAVAGRYFYNPTNWAWLSNRIGHEVGPLTLNLTDFVNAGSDPANAYGWKGCVEARATVQSITGAETSFSTVPSGAWDIRDVAPGVSGAPAYRPYIYLPEYDSNGSSIYGPSGGNYYGMPDGSQSSSPVWDLVGPYAATKIPYRVRTNQSTLASESGHGNVSNSTYASNGPNADSANKACPERVRLLDEHDTDDLKDYLDTLTPSGNTFHDVGMYWGLALISPEAPFANPDTYIAPGSPGTAQPVKRYIVFMTDGDINANGNTYSAYGYETRPTSAGNNVTADRNTAPDLQHRVRFRMLCDAAKRQGIEVSTVAFSTSIGSGDRAALQGCATSVDHYYTASSAAALNTAFENIAKNIGHLRVSK